MSAPERYAFGEFVLERSQQRVLRKDGSELALTPRLFSALLLFVENADALLGEGRPDARPVGRAWWSRKTTSARPCRA